MQYPATWRSASSSATACATDPMTTASSASQWVVFAHFGRRIGSPGPVIAVTAFMYTRGTSGTGVPDSADIE